MLKLWKVVKKSDHHCFKDGELVLCFDRRQRNPSPGTSLAYWSILADEVMGQYVRGQEIEEADNVLVCITKKELMALKLLAQMPEVKHLFTSTDIIE